MSERGNAGSARIAQLQWPVVSSVRFTLSLGLESLRFRCLSRIPHTVSAEVIQRAPQASKSPVLPGFSIFVDIQFGAPILFACGGLPLRLASGAMLMYRATCQRSVGVVIVLGFACTETSQWKPRGNVCPAT